VVARVETSGDTDVIPVAERADDVPGPRQGCWTYADYAAIPDDGRRYEVIDGVLYVNPSPGTSHQDTTGNIYVYLRNAIKRAGLGRVFLAPYDVELYPCAVVQPDVAVVLAANAGIITDTRIADVPDLVVEVASPSTMAHDLHRKLRLYARAAVPEGWLPNPATRRVELLRFDPAIADYRSLGAFGRKKKLPSVVVPDLRTPVERFFE
jgi:Uma2 family endonuclease